MIRKFKLPVLLTLCLVVLPTTIGSQAQTTSATVPRLVRYAGVARDLDGKPLSGVVGITFSLYAEQTGDASLWAETQNVQADGSGHYAVLLGSTKPDGLPAELFTSEQARWIGVQVEQQAEQPRTLLVSAPYALKAGDAETLGGLPPSAFLRTASEEARTASQSPASGGSASGSTKAVGAIQSGQPQSAVTTSGGTAKTIPMFTTPTNIQNSILTQTGTVELNAIGSAAADSAPIIWLKNNAAVQAGSIGNSIDLRFSPDKTGTVAKPDAFIRAQETGSGHTSTSLQFGTLAQGGSTASERMRITASGLVGIGTVIPTNEQGEATVSFPSWFEALNTDFRYQLTVLEQFAQAIVARKIQNHEFIIKTSVPNVEVSWQVTGVRHDAFAMANPLVVEEEKEARLRGFYIHPDLHGAPAERQIEWARHPQTIMKMQQHRQQMKQEAAKRLNASAKE